MATIPYMPLYVADYMADTAHLTTLEHGAYLLLIMAYWQSGKPLYCSNERLATVARMSNDRWNEVRPALEEFFEEKDGFWHHKRVDAEIQRINSKLQQASEAGKASAQRRLKIRSNENPTDVERPLPIRSNILGVGLGKEELKEKEDKEKEKPPAQPKSVSPKKYYPPESFEVWASEQIAQTVLELNPHDEPTNKAIANEYQHWASEIATLMKNPSRTETQVRDVITWLKGSSKDAQWWRGKQIRSTAKFRAKYDDFVLKMNAERTIPNQNSPPRKQNHMEIGLQWAKDREARRLQKERGT